MGYYDPLIQIWPSVQGADTQAKLAAVNAMTVAGPRKLVLISDVMDYLRTNNLWLDIKASAASATPSPGAAAAVDYNSDPRAQTINFDLDIVKEMLADLVTHSLLTQAQSDALSAMGNSVQPWWQANGYKRQINMGDIVVAGLDNTTGYSVQIGAPSPNQLNVAISLTVTGPRGTETITTFASTLDADYSKFFAANCIQNMITRDASLASFGG